MKAHLPKRILALAVAVVMALGNLPAASAASTGLRWKRSDADVTWDSSERLVQDVSESDTHKPTDMVRVSIVLEDAPTAGAGYATMDIASNAAARAYDQTLNRTQQTMARTISAQALDGQKLDVVWNLTLVANIISANVPYGRLDAIRAIDGVKKVVLERQYSPDETVETDLYASSGMIGSAAVWESGYTGAGSRVAIVDTGTDTDHQSFDNGAYLYALEQNAAAKGMSVEAYTESLELLDVEEIRRVLPLLNAAERVGAAAGDYYISEKLPFGANYVDRNLTVNHDSDSQGSHGSHVAGIAAANRYIPQGDGYVDARQSVFMNGVAPDAQIITLKVFGSAAGPYDSDYFAAIEDAIWLGCDSVNLSLGSGNPGTSGNKEFEELLKFLETTDTVVVMSAGNSGHWAEASAAGALYQDGVSFHTGGSPGTYTNSLCVASVDNDGAVGQYFTVAGRMIVYAETTGYYNKAMSTLDTTGNGTDYEYVFIDGIGSAPDYDGMDLNGKVVFCSRGTTSFSEKATAAAKLGAAAVVIYNNTSGVINMDLGEYRCSAPCVSILQSEAAAIKAASTAQTTGTGTVYYTGAITICSALGASQYGSAYYTMSSFSSWGVPGSLEMKPEITAPGGMIWSVNGTDTSGTAYELMSGTSMAAPQVTGMAALVVQYLEEQGLDAQTGLSLRHLAQSLLMSTAQPLYQEAGGNYYSVLNQGAGLARVDLATSAESYVLVEDMEDGKVKVELGEDAGREGTYTFCFSIHNLNGRAMTYVLRADLFTQDLYEGGDGTLYLDTQTRTLDAEAAFRMDGISLEGMADGFACDLNGDGSTGTADADYLLEYLVGNADQLRADGDVNGDGKVNSHDAHVLLAKGTGAYSVDVPAGGSVTVEVELQLTRAARAYLEEHYPVGAYVEGFVYAEPVTDAEGVQAVTHSIPVLGYYGSWTEASMYDVGGYVEYLAGAETRTPYLQQSNGIQYNFLTIDYGDGNEYVFGGNPFVDEAEYLPQRNAFNNQRGCSLAMLRFGLIRNASDAKLLIENAETGQVYWEQNLGAMDGAYYYTNAGTWENTLYRASVGQWDPSRLPEDTVVNVSLVTAPEYYCTYDAQKEAYAADWDALGHGAYLTTSFTIDNTDPRLLDVTLDPGNGSALKVTAIDNQYIAAVALMNAAGTSMLSSAAGNQTAPGTELTASLDLSGVFGSEFLVAVYDYAGNRAVYEITLELDSERPRFTAIDRTRINEDQSVNYVGLNADGTSVTLAPTPGRDLARAAEYVEGYVFEISDDNKLYVGSDADLHSFRLLRELDPDDVWQIVGFNDLAYNTADGKLYGNFYSDRNHMNLPYLCTIDLYTGEMTVLGQMPVDVNTLAADDEGNFYATGYAASKLYTFRADVATTQKYTYVGSLEGADKTYYSSMINSLAWDHETDELFWACCKDKVTYLVEIDPAAAKVTHVNSFDFSTAGLYIANQGDESVLAPTDHVSSVTMEQTAQVLVQSSVTLTAQVWPWNVSDSSVTWTSSSPDVASVDGNGTVCGVAEGTAVITAASRLDPAKTASCTVTVSALNKELKALVWDQEGKVWWSSFNTDTLPAYSKLAAAKNNLPVTTTAVIGGSLYAGTLDTSTGLSDLYAVDPGTFTMTKVGGSDSICYTDMAYAPKLGYLMASCFGYIAMVDPATGERIGVFNWSGDEAGDLVGITYFGSEYNSAYSAWVDTFLILDTQGNVYLEGFIPYGSSYANFNGPESGLILELGEAVDCSYFQGFHFDGEFVYWTRFNEADNVVELIVWDCLDSGNVYHLGSFPEGVWPVGGVYTDGDLTGGNALTASFAQARVSHVQMLGRMPAVDLTGDHAGGLNAVSHTQPMGGGSGDFDGSIEVDVALDRDAANGVFVVEYDPGMLVFAGVKSGADAEAHRSKDGGRVEVAFADAAAFAAGDGIACLSFFPERMAQGETEITIRITELNDRAADMTQTVPVVIPHSCPSAGFVDVSQDQWFHKAVDYVVGMGYMKGMTATTFGPDMTMTRAQFVTVLYRMDGSPDVEQTNRFADVEANRFYTQAVAWAVESGIAQGMTATDFGPDLELTRAQLVTFMYRYADYKGYDTTVAVDLSAYSDSGTVPKFSRTAFCWALTHNIIKGITSTTLVPSGQATRAQAAAIFQRFDLNLAK